MFSKGSDQYYKNELLDTEVHFQYPHFPTEKKVLYPWRKVKCKDDLDDTKDEPDEPMTEVKKDEPEETDSDGEPDQSGPSAEDNDIRDMRYKLETLGRTLE